MLQTLCSCSDVFCHPVLEGGWHQQGHVVKKVSSPEGTSIQYSHRYAATSEGWLSTLCCWEAAVRTHD